MVPPSGAAAKTEVRPAEETLTVILQHKRSGSLSYVGEGTHVLYLEVYPLRGIAVARTESNNYEIENNDSVAYAEQTEKDWTAFLAAIKAGRITVSKPASSTTPAR